jgi:hypothetical protein
VRAVIRCPSTQLDYEIDLPARVSELQHLWRKTVGSDCPHCAEVHLDGFRQLFAHAVLDLRRT